MWTLDAISEKHIGHYQEINIRTMSRNDDNRTLCGLVMTLQLRNSYLINHNSLVDRTKDLVQKPSE